MRKESQIKQKKTYQLTKLKKCALDNPDLTMEFIEEILLSKKQVEKSLPFKFEDYK
jgi:hypothetical protein